MKRLIYLVLVLAATTSFGQVQTKAGSSAHLAFMGTPINGSLSAFVSGMEKNGFTKVHSEEGYALLVGDYMSHRNSMVAVETLKDEVSKVAVMFPPLDSWSALSTDYFAVKKMLTEKYGKPADQVERFLGAPPADDIARMDQVKSNNSEYYTTYETSSGSIQVSIEHDKSLKCFVQLAYYDKINGADM